MAALFLIQTLVGWRLATLPRGHREFLRHRSGRHFAVQLVRTWHLQLAIFWVATSYLAAGIFLAPMISGREPKDSVARLRVAGRARGGRVRKHVRRIRRNSRRIENVDGSAIKDSSISISAVSGKSCLPSDCFSGCHAVSRLARPPADEQRETCPGCFFFRRFRSQRFTPLDCWRGRKSHFTTTDFWRFWVVHLWVEDFLELFTTIMVAYIFVLLGVVAGTRRATVFISTSSSIRPAASSAPCTTCTSRGTGRTHGSRCILLRREVIPLTFLTIEAWSFLQLGALQKSNPATTFPH